MKDMILYDKTKDLIEAERKEYSKKESEVIELLLYKNKDKKYFSKKVLAKDYLVLENIIKEEDVNKSFIGIYREHQMYQWFNPDTSECPIMDRNSYKKYKFVG